MVGRTHRIGGILFGAGATILASPVVHPEHLVTFAGAMMAGGAIGSLIPDIDKKGTTASKALGPVSNVINKRMHHRGITHSLIALVVYSLVVVALAQFMQHMVRTETVEVVESLFEIFIVGSSISFCIHSFNRKVEVIKRDKMFFVIGIVYILSIIFVLTTQGGVVEFIAFYLYGTTIGYLSHLALDILNKAGIPLFKPLWNTKFHLANVITGTGAEGIIAKIMMVLIVICIIQIGSMEFGTSLVSLL